MDGQQITELLKRIGWSGGELSRRLGVREITVSRWVRGQRDIPENVAAWLIVVADKLDEAPALPEGWRSE